MKLAGPIGYISNFHHRQLSQVIEIARSVG